jgi:cytoskeletal protein CcmA (bactofilin family)
MKFKTNAAPALSSAANATRGVPTIISADMVIEGNFKTAGDIQVEGQITGQIEAGRLVLAEGGIINGNVTADHARICGTLNGGVSGGTITLTATAKVTGDVLHDVLAIEAGGLLEGHSRRRGPKLAVLPAATQEAAE